MSQESLTGNRGTNVQMQVQVCRGSPVLEGRYTQSGQSSPQGISSLQTIVRAQVFFLLSTLTKDNYDTTVMQLKDLYKENGPDIYLHLLRRLIQYNVGTILGLTRMHENPATYKLLSEEIYSLSTTPSASYQFGNAISGAASGIFNDFDMKKFCRYFDLDAFQKSVLASSLLQSSKKDLQALEIMIENIYGVIEIIKEGKYQSKLTDDEIVIFLNQYFHEEETFTLNSHQKFLFDAVIREKYSGTEVPVIVEEALQQYLKLDDTLQMIIDVLKIIDLDVPAFEETLKGIFYHNKIIEKTPFNEFSYLISDTLFIMSTPGFIGWDTEIFGKIIFQLIPELNVEDIIKTLDRPTIPTRNYFKLDMFLKGISIMIENDKSHFPLKFLWAPWKHPHSQLQILQYLTSMSSDSFNLLSYSCQKILSLENFQDSSSTIKAFAANLETQIWNSFDLIKTMIILLDNPKSNENASAFLDKAMQLAPELVFLGLAQKQKPWSVEHVKLMDKGFDMFFSRHSNYQLVFIRLWQVNPEYMGSSFIKLHSKNPTCINQILNISEDLKIKDSLLKLRPYSFSIDFAAQASKRQYLNLEKWLQDNINENHDFFIRACLDYLNFKSSLENTQQFSDTSSPATRLRIETVAIFLRVLMNNSMSAANSELFRSVQTICLQVYPRLMNIGQGRDEIITSNNEINTFSKDVEQQQEAYYQRLYKGDLSISDCIILLQKLKVSENPRDQDLFACMLHSLFDEYRFFPEYPTNALAITAILFGSLIQYQLLSYIPLGIALRYVLDAIQQPPNSNMFNFGVQALIQFQSRIAEWPQYISHILRVTHLRIFHPELVQNIRNSLNATRHTSFGGNSNLITESSQTQQYLPFISVRLSKPLRDASFFEDPSESVQDKILFIINNMSHGNLDQKTEELRECLLEQYYSWFSKHLVKRASTEPNYHSLYFQLLNTLNIDFLKQQILHETYANVILLLNSEKTMLSTMERGFLKNLGSWLGGITLSQNKPIKHNNIAFKELLLEGYDSKRLMVVLPFTCKVLEQAANSKVFKPPNAWLMGILKLLAELYESTDIKLNLKFEIEVLCKKLDLDIKFLESTSLLKGKTSKIESEKINENETYHNQDKPSKKTSAETTYFHNNLMNTNFVIPNLSNHFVINQGITMFMNATSLKRVLQIAIDRAIREIIGPVVERSVTIAGISTKELITKDFATDPSEEKMKNAAHIMVQNLASSLALVTCKEALRISITTNLRNILLQNGINNQQFPEQAAMLIVSDNLDLACSIIEKAAMERAIPEIDENLSVAFANRKRHKEMRSRHLFLDPSVQRVPLSLPDPLRLKPHGLTAQQLATYEEFSRIPRTASQAISIYAHEESPHQANIASENNMYGIDSEMSHQRNSSAFGLSSLISQTVEKLTIIILELEKISSEANFQYLSDVPLDHDIYKLLKQICNSTSQLKASIKDDIILVSAQRVLQLLFKGSESTLMIETLSVLLKKFSEQSPKTFKDIEIWLLYSNDKRKLDANVMAALIKVGLITSSELDIQLSKQIMKQNNAVIEFTVSLIKKILLSISTYNFQTEFSNCLDAFEILSRRGEVPHSVTELLQIVHISNMEKTKTNILPSMNETTIQEQLAYIFAEWIRLSTHPASNEKTYIAFILQLQREKIITDEQLSYTFFRVAIDLSINNLIKQLENYGSSNNPNYLPIDSLSKLIVLLIKYYSDENDNKPNILLKIKYFSSILSIITLVFANYHETFGRNFYQKPFYKLFANMLYEFNNETYFSDIQYDILETLGETFLALQPLHFPKFTFAWMTLISHRYFMSSLLLLPDYKGYPIYNKIIITLLEFIAPLLEETELHDTTRMLYKGTLRLLLVLLHDFPSFLADYHFSFCSIIPSNCIQLRNLILSASPKTIRLPDPFQSGLKVDQLPESSQNPTIRTDIYAVLKRFGLRDQINSYLSGENVKDIISNIISKLRTCEESIFKQELKPKSRINVPFINSLVLYIGMKTIEDFQLQNNGAQLIFSPTSASMTLFVKLHNSLDFEGRYYFLEAITNQLRYPNSHTYYFSSVLLSLFENSTDESNIMKEQITRILLERFICNRPHPWGLLITFIELLKNSYYNFWSLPFIKSIPEFECLFNSLFSHINKNIESVDATK
ncbi:hypothetical protein T552_01499 [Pneumocystis carinii B80]|uniref:General negative regulator of transcription subunit 1 n=1 Tax=Pneumocystis carinii (strain B80) TaxID=1408658 RepID=A0A0W4ZKI3_PNEC8|nr:hypothetical protein T552_01499 [Pneumocystis carinii B80]KTW28870.1 hypothetical protein T552_01499 [Pneumocystis carinii B80]